MSPGAAAFLAAALVLAAGACAVACTAAAALRRPRNPPQDGGDIEALIDATREPRTATRWSARAWAELDALTETAKDQNQ